MTTNDNRIFVPGKLTEFEKLLFAQRAIKDLQNENRTLRAENDGLQRTVKNFNELFASSPTEKRQFKADNFYKNIQYRLLEVSAKLRRFKNDNARLMAKLIIQQIELETIAEDPTSDKAKEIIARYRLKIEQRKEQDLAEQN